MESSNESIPTTFHSSEVLAIPNMPEKSKTLSKKEKYITTAVMMYTHFAFGMMNSQGISAQLDMKHIYDVTLQVLTISNLFSFIGYFIGAMSGFLFKYINRQILCIIMLTIISVAKASLPHLPSIGYLYGLYLVFGIGSGCWDMSQNVWFLEMWGGKYANTILNLSQFLFGIGGVLGALLDKPFIIGEPAEEDKENKTLFMFELENQETFSDLNYNTTGEERRKLLTIPFAISSIFQVIAPIMLLTLYLIKKYEAPTRIIKENEEKKVKILENPSSNLTLVIGREISYNINTRILIIVLASMTLAFYTGLLELCFFNFSGIFAQKIPLHVSASDSAVILAVMSGTFTLSRALGAIIGMKVSVKIMLTCHLATVAASIILLFFSFHSRIILWIGSIMIGFGFSICRPGIFAFFEQLFDFTDKIGAIMVASSGIVGAVVPILLGGMIESNPSALLYINSFAIITVIILFTVINIIVYLVGKN